MVVQSDETFEEKGWTEADLNTAWAGTKLPTNRLRLGAGQIGHCEQLRLSKHAA